MLINQLSKQATTLAILIIKEPRLSKTLANCVFTQIRPLAYHAICNIKKSVRGTTELSVLKHNTMGEGRHSSTHS